MFCIMVSCNVIYVPGMIGDPWQVVNMSTMILMDTQKALAGIVENIKMMERLSKGLAWKLKTCL